MSIPCANEVPGIVRNLPYFSRIADKPQNRLFQATTKYFLKHND